MLAGGGAYPPGVLILCPCPPSVDGGVGGGGSILRREEPLRAPRVHGAGPQAEVTRSRLRLRRALLVVPRAPPVCLLVRPSPHALPQPPRTPTTRGQEEHDHHRRAGCCSPSPACLGAQQQSLDGCSQSEGLGGTGVRVPPAWAAGLSGSCRPAPWRSLEGGSGEPGGLAGVELGAAEDAEGLCLPPSLSSPASQDSRDGRVSFSQ